MLKWEIRVLKVAIVGAFLFISAEPGLADFCEPLPAPDQPTETVSSEAQLRDRAYNAPAGTTIFIAAGTYHLGSYIHIRTDGVSLRGATGARDDVVLDFGGMTTGHFGILVEADNVTIADLTIQNARDHGVSISGTDNPVLYNLHIVDINDQLVKVNPVGDGSDDGLLACSLLEYSTTDPDGYTNGISAHNAHRWTVRDNIWRRIRTNDDSAVPTILFWSGSSDTLVERNLLVDCYQGISFGNASHGPGDHVGGIVRNNVIYNTLAHDVAIEMVHATGWMVAHNTVLLMNPAGGLTWGIEARFADTAGSFFNNLSNMAVWPDRDGAGAASLDNIETAALDWFVQPDGLDFRLTTIGQAAIDQGTVIPVTPVSEDYHGQMRDTLPDIGADEWLPSLADLISVLKIASGVAANSELVVDINSDGHTGLAEAIYLLDRLAGSD